MVLRTLHPDELDDPELLHRNRLTMLRYLAATACECCDAFAPNILGARRDGVTLFQLECRLAPLDPTVSRAAGFKLVLSGALYCPTLTTQLLGVHSVLVTRLGASRSVRCAPIVARFQRRYPISGSVPISTRAHCPSRRGRN